MQLIVQPEHGVAPLVAAVESATQTHDLIIFRFDLEELETAVRLAVRRGVAVRALIAHRSSDGRKRRRKLEDRLLEAGVTVSRTSDDLVRYHGKAMVVDRSELHVYGFNYTTRDLKSRSFGLMTRGEAEVQEALRLFDADARRQRFEPSTDGALIVSPSNARAQLAAFIARARKRLEIWDPRLTDAGMIRLLRDRVDAGVDVRILGKAGRRGEDLPVRTFAGRLHVRAMIRDGEQAFVGSQSLRAVALDERRELGLVTRAPDVVTRMTEIFEEDWNAAVGNRAGPKHRAAAGGDEPRDGGFPSGGRS